MDRSLPRINGRPQHYMRPTPSWVSYQAQINSEHSIAYTTAIPLAVAPPVVGDSLLSCIQVSVALRTAESGADASNYTQVEIRMGTTASYETLATLDTQDNPAALEILTANLHKYLKPGALIFAYWTRTGAAVDYAGDFGLVTLDIIGERQP